MRTASSPTLSIQPTDMEEEIEFHQTLTLQRSESQDPKVEKKKNIQYKNSLDPSLSLSLSLFFCSWRLAVL